MLDSLHCTDWLFPRVLFLHIVIARGWENSFANGVHLSSNVLEFYNQDTKYYANKLGMNWAKIS